jgi:hypothetical protein
LDDNDVRIYKDFVTHDKNPTKLLQEFERQMYDYERTVVVGNSLRNKNTVVLSGKGSNKKKLDDLCLTFQRAVRARQRFLFDPKFQKLHI